MSYHDNDDLLRALNSLSIFDIWERAFNDGQVAEPPPPHRRDGLYKSPFRDDGRTGSFSVCGGGEGFKDFGGDGVSGKCWAFAQLCYPRHEKGDLAKLLIDLSGIVPTPPPAPRRAQGAAVSPGVDGATAHGAPGALVAVDPAVLRAARSIEKKRRERELEDRVWEQREEALRPQIEAKRVPDWPAFVAERYADGVAELAGSPTRVRQLARDRGWPVEWADYLVREELVAYPWERWAIPGRTWAKRQKAFRVDVPEISIVPRPGDDGAMAVATMRPIGFHQRWFLPAQNGEPASKGWAYFPSLPKTAPKTTFEVHLVEYAASLGVTTEKRRGLIPPLPFVLGDLAGPRLVVLLEGQWDAVTFAGACGWLYDGNPPEGVSVFGIRGAQGVEPFLAYWEKWLRHNKPLVWIIADNDKAGQSWYVPKKGLEGMPDPPSLAERLEYLGCRKVITSHLQGDEFGKDFNDYYKEAEPRQEDMISWMKHVGVMTSAGRWA